MTLRRSGRTGASSNRQEKRQPRTGRPCQHVRARAAQARQRMRPSRRTLTALAAAVVAVLAVAGILLSKLGDPVGLARGLLNIPTPVPAATATSIPFDTSWFYLENGTPWGVLTIDGRRRADLNTATLATLLLPRGRHTIAYDAAPFAPLRCVASVPADTHDTCPLDRNFAQHSGPLLGLKRALDLGAIPDRLPADQRAALAAAVQQQIALDPTPAIVAPGERYLGTDGEMVTATQTLRATLVRAPWGDAPSQDFATSCSFLCLGAPPAPSPSPSSQPPPTWEIVAHVREGYRFEATNGQVVVALAPLGPLAPGGVDRREALVSVHVRWDGAWHVTQDATLSGPITCEVALGMTPFGNFASAQPPYTLGPALPAPHPADGCVVSLLPAPQNADAPAGPITFLYRFGVLLAVSPGAQQVTQQLDPDWPVATSDERALAQAIIAQSH